MARWQNALISLGFARSGVDQGAYILVVRLEHAWDVWRIGQGPGGEPEMLTFGTEDVRGIDYVNSLNLDLAPPSLLGVLVPKVAPNVDIEKYMATTATESSPSPDHLPTWWRELLDRKGAA